MPTVQIYEADKEVKLFDGHLLITLNETGYRRNVGFSKGAATRIFKRFGYQRTSDWKRTDWGHEAFFKRQQES